MTKNDSLTLIIQAGGKSLRMGYDKALKEFLGEPLVQRLVKRFQPLGQEIAIIARSPLDYAFLNIPIYTDAQPNMGALGGLLTAMTVAHTPFAAVVACDMPFANPELLRDEWGLMLESGADVVIPDHQKLQPFHAVYRVETCLPAIYSAMERGEKKVVSWLDDVNVCKIPTVKIRKFDPLCLAFMNLNTPDDFKSAEKIARYYKR